MLKYIELQKPVKLIIMRDGKEISRIFVPQMTGYVDTDKFKHVETTYDQTGNQFVVKIEVQ